MNVANTAAGVALFVYLVGTDRLLLAAGACAGRFAGVKSLARRAGEGKLAAGERG